MKEEEKLKRTELRNEEKKTKKKKENAEEK